MSARGTGGAAAPVQEEFELPEWLAELSDDLEVFVAQREFEQAVDLGRAEGAGF